MLNQPTSSAMTTTMFGFLAGEASWAWTATVLVAALAIASSLPLFRPSEQVTCVDASLELNSGEASARADRSTRPPTDAAAYPRQAPAVMNSNTEVRDRFIRQTPLAEL